MKKKLALLLAAVMLITAALPMNLLAVTNPRLTTYTSNHGNGTVMPDTGNLVSGITGNLGPGNLRYSRWGTNSGISSNRSPYGETNTMLDTSTGTGSIFANDGSGSYLVLEFPTGYNTSTASRLESFTITLDNAVWYPYSSGNNALYSTGDWNTTYGSLLTSNLTAGAVYGPESYGMKTNLQTTGGTPVRGASSSTTTAATDYMRTTARDIVYNAVLEGLAAVKNSGKATDTSNDIYASEAYALYQVAVDASIDGSSWTATTDAFKKAEISDMKTTAYAIYQGLWNTVRNGESITALVYNAPTAIIYNGGLQYLYAKAAAELTTNVPAISPYITSVYNATTYLNAKTIEDVAAAASPLPENWKFITVPSTTGIDDTNPSVIPWEFINAYNQITSSPELMKLIGLTYGDYLPYESTNPALAPYISGVGASTGTAYIYGNNNTAGNSTHYATSIDGGTTVTERQDLLASTTKMLNDFSAVLKAIANTTDTTLPTGSNYAAILAKLVSADAALYFDKFVGNMQTTFTGMTDTDAKKTSLIVEGETLPVVAGLENLRIGNGLAYIDAQYYRDGSTTPATYTNTYADAATKFARENNSFNSSDAIALPYSMAIDTTNASGSGAGRMATITFDLSTIGTIKAGDMIIIPLVIKTLTSGSDVTYTINSSTGAVSQVGTTIISGQGSRTGVTTTTLASVANAAKGRIYLSDLIITERSLGILTDGTIWIIPPKGYDALLVTQNAQIISTAGLFTTQSTTKGSLSGTGWSIAANQFNFSDPSTGNNARLALGLTITGFNTPSQRSSIGTMRISGIALNPRSNDPDMIYNLDEDLYIRVYTKARMASSSYNFLNTSYAYDANYTDMGVTPYDSSGETQIKAASRQEWNLNYSAETAVLAFSGKMDVETAVVTVEEKTYNSWYAKQDTTFTLVDSEGNPLEGVKFSAAYVNSDNMWDVYNNRFRDSSSYGTSYNTWDYGKEFLNLDKAEGYTGSPMEYSNASFSRDGGIFRVTDLYTASSVTPSAVGYSSTDVLAKMKLAFTLSAEANFEGEVWLEIGGPAVTSETTMSSSRVKIAEFFPPVTISTESTEVQMGWQKYNLADVVITENFDAVGSSAYEAGKKVQIAIGEYGQGKLTEYLYFTPVAKGDISIVGDPNFTISEVTMVNLATTNTYVGVSQRVIEFTVMRKAKTMGSEITLTNLEVNVGRDTPNGEYDLLVGGNSIVDNWIQPNSNYLYLYDKFDVFGVVEPGYIKMVTEASGIVKKNVVTLKSGTNIIQVDGVDQEIPVPVLNVDGRMYVPIRFAAVALNVPDSNIIFDEGSRKVVITTAERIVTFQQDSPIYTINGVELSMNEGGVEAVTFIDPQTERAYIPVRFLAYALNVSVDYDAETGEATLNAK